MKLEIKQRQIDRFFKRLKDGENGCLEWQGARNAKHYGYVSVNGRLHKAHRVAWAIRHNRWPNEGMLICHHCDNPPCCNPDHLYEGTPRQNNMDAVSRGRHRNGSASMVGESHPMAILTETDVMDIRSLVESLSYKDIAAKYGVSRGLIYLIKTRKVWKHL